MADGESEFKTDDTKVTATALNNEIMSLMEGLPTSPIVMDTVALQELCNNWKSMIISIDLNPSKIEASFNSFTQLEILVAYIPNLSNAINTTLSTIDSIISNILSNSNSQSGADDQIKVSSTGYSDGTYSPGDAGTVNFRDDITLGNTNFNLNANESYTLSNLDSSTSSMLLNNLVNIAKNNNVDLTTLLTDERYSSIIKQELLNINNMSKELIEIITNINPQMLQIQLKNILNNGTDIFKVDSSNYTILHKHLSNVALSNNTTVNELLTNKTNEGSLKKALESFNEISQYTSSLNSLDAAGVQNSLADVYAGNDVSQMTEQNINGLRDLIEITASNKRISAEDLLYNKENANTLKTICTDLGQASNYIGYLNSSSGDTIREALTKIINNNS